MGPTPPADVRGRLRLALKQSRRFVAYWLLAVPLLALARHAPMGLIRFVLRRIAEPIVHRQTRATTMRHLEMAFGDEMSPERRAKVARAVARNFVLATEETLAVLRQGPKFYEDRIDDEEARRRLHALEATNPRGLVAITGHIGNWELLGQWFARNSTRGLGAVIAKRRTNPWLNDRLERVRREFGLETYYRDEPASKPVRMLRSGMSIATVPDQDVRYLAGTFVEFFGRPAYTPIGPARLALAANVPMMCGFFLRNDDGTYRVVIGDPIHPDRSLPREEEIERLTRAWSADVERIVRAHPEQWAWFHRRWRTTPERLAQRGQTVRTGLATS